MLGQGDWLVFYFVGVTKRTFFKKEKVFINLDFLWVSELKLKCTHT